MPDPQQSSGFVDALKQPDNMATLLVLAGALAQGGNNPGTIAQKVGGALAFRGEMDNVRRDRGIQDKGLAMEQAKTDATVQDTQSNIQYRKDTVANQRTQNDIQGRQVAVAEGALPSQNREREAQAGYYDRMPQQRQYEMDLARIQARAERNKIYGQMQLVGLEGYNAQIKAALADPMLSTDPAKLQQRMQQIAGSYAQQTKAIAQLKDLEETTGETGWIEFDPKTGSFVTMHRLLKGQVAPVSGSTVAAVPPASPTPAATPQPSLRAKDLPAAEAADKAKADAAVKVEAAKAKDLQGEYDFIKKWDEPRIAATLRRKNLDPVTRKALEKRQLQLVVDGEPLPRSLVTLDSRLVTEIAQTPGQR